MASLTITSDVSEVDKCPPEQDTVHVANEDGDRTDPESHSINSIGSEGSEENFNQTQKTERINDTEKRKKNCETVQAEKDETGKEKPLISQSGSEPVEGESKAATSETQAVAELARSSWTPSSTVAGSCTTNVTVQDNIYHIKSIIPEPSCRHYHFLLQNENGPCPLLAVVNLLLLRGVKSLLSEDCIAAQVIRNSDLIHRLSNYICDISAKAICKNPALSESIESTTAEVGIIFAGVFLMTCFFRCVTL